MAVCELHVIKDTFKEKEVHWEIPDFLSLDADELLEAPIIEFLQARFFLQLNPFELHRKDDVGLRLTTDVMKSSFGVMCTIGIKKSDGSVFGNNYFKHTFTNLKVTLLITKFFDRNDLLHNKSELVPLNNLTIVCNLKSVCLIDPVELTELNTLSENFKSLLTDKEFCDTALQVKDKKFKAHKIILSARSSVFAAMFKHEMSEKESGIVNIPDCDPDSFPEFLEFLYCGKLENVKFHNALQLYKTADKYDVQELKKFCTEFMRNNLRVDNVCNIILLAEKYDELDILAAAQEFFNRNLSDIFTSDGWKDLLKQNFNLANELLIQMALKVKVVK